jgi:protein-S-isoprenylcysteine O-methyltransferase Ste14
MDLFWYFSVLAAFYSTHSVLAAEGVKKKAAARFPLSTRYYRLFYNLQSVLWLCLVVWHYRLLDQQLLFDPGWWRWMGGMSVFSGCYVSMAALERYDLGHFLGWRQVSQPGATEFSKLETKGWNGLVRHPLYFGLLLLTVGGFLWFPTDVHLITAVLTTVYLVVGSRLEEHKLIGHFGDAYREYRTTVPGLLPFSFLKRK